MENPRPEKVAVVDEVRERFDTSDAVLLTEYRGINVTELADLRRALRVAGGDYKIYKNTLVRFAVRDLGLEIEELLTGPTALAFVPRQGSGDPVMVAKALRDFAKGNPNLIVKCGVLDWRILSVDETKALAEVAPRDELLARLAGLMAAPMQQFAALLQAVPQNFAYALQALITEKGGPEATAATDATIDSAEAVTAEPTTETEEAAPEAAAQPEATATAEAATETEEATPEVADDQTATEES